MEKNPSDKQEELFPGAQQKDKNIAILEKVIRKIDLRNLMRPKKSKRAESLNKEENNA